MKRIPVYFAIFLGCILIFNCKKTNDAIQKSNQDLISESVQHKVKELGECRVEQIIRQGWLTQKDTLLFNYNTLGDPVYIKRLPRPATGSPSYVFKYDEKHRLTDVIGLYNNETVAEFWQKYFYEKSGASSNIVMDSSFSFVQVKDGQIVSYIYSATTHFTYDKWDRVIKDSTIWSDYGGSIVVNRYLYNSDGNLVGRVYDDKVNIHRTNKVWMFFDRDYSVNNPFLAAAYNSSGLPTRFAFSFAEPYYMDFLDYFKEASITYSCGKDHNPH
jgi:hypothetical protein